MLKRIFPATKMYALLFSGFFLSFATFAVTQGNLLPPQQIVEQTSEAVKKALQREGYRLDLAKANRIVTEIVEPHVDVDRAAALILGKYWRTATPEQKERFKNEFRTLLIRTYTTAFNEYRDWDIRYLPLQMSADDTKVLVKTEIMQPGAKPAPVDYRMAYSAAGWKVYDVLIQGISLVQNYRTTFGNDVARTGSLESVINELAEKNRSGLQQPLTGGKPLTSG